MQPGRSHDCLLRNVKHARLAGRRVRVLVGERVGPRRQPPAAADAVGDGVEVVGVEVAEAARLAALAHPRLRGSR